MSVLFMRSVARFAYLGTFLLGALSAGAAQAQTFTNATAESGLEAVRMTMPDGWWLSGVSFVDLDGDGDLDVYMSGHGQPGLAALNDGKGHFTAAMGAYPKTEVHLAYDANEDGKVDLTMTYEDGGGQWWLNQSTPAALDFKASITRESGSSRQQALIDIDRDGKVDWLRGNGPGVLVDLGDGKGAFATVSRTIANPGTDSIAMIPFDMDADGDEDLVVEWGRYDTEEAKPPVFGLTRIYRNDGTGTFADVTTEVGLYEANLAILGAGDFDHDGDLDLVGLESKKFPHAIFLNDGSGRFVKKAGAVSGSPAGSAGYASWGLASTTDLDNDGIADIIVDGRNYLHVLRGTGSGAFVYSNATWGNIVNTAEASVDNGYAFGDIDADGDLDLMGYRQISPRYVNLYRNDLPTKNWINVRPVGLAGNRGAAGARIKIYEPGTQNLLWYEEIAILCKQVQQNSYAYAETERHFGLGSRATVDVAVHFYPSNKLVRMDGVAANGTVRITEEGAGSVVPPSPRDAGIPIADGSTGSGGARPELDGGGFPTGPGGRAGSASAGAGGGGAGGADPLGEKNGVAEGGCACALGSSSSSPSPWMFACAVAFAAARRRREPRGPSPRTPAVGVHETIRTTTVTANARSSARPAAVPQTTRRTAR